MNTKNEYNPFALKAPLIFAITSPVILPVLEQLVKHQHQIRIHQSFENAYNNFEATILDFQGLHIFLLNADSPEIRAEIRKLRQYFFASIAIILYSGTKKSPNEIISFMKFGADEYLEIPQDSAQFYTALETKFNTFFQDPLFRDHTRRYIEFRRSKENWFDQILSDAYSELSEVPRYQNLFKKQEHIHKGCSVITELEALLQFLQKETQIELPPREKVVVLTVDDDDLVLENLNLLLGDHFIVLQAEDALDAVNMFRTHDTIDIVLLDIMMPADRIRYLFPDGKGTTILPFLKTIKPKAEFIMLTAYDDAELISESLRKGAIDYLVKDRALNQKTLIKKIQDVADKVYYDTVLTDLIEHYRKHSKAKD